MTAQTDRELLEAAARAAGVPLRVVGAEPGSYALYPEADGVDRMRCMQQWNPLTSSADAFELAVKLRINIEHLNTMSGKPYGINCWPSGRGDCGFRETGNVSDPAAATRRAITRAAAAMDSKSGADG